MIQQELTSTRNLPKAVVFCLSWTELACYTNALLSALQYDQPRKLSQVVTFLIWEMAQHSALNGDYPTRAGLAAKLILESDLLTGTIISPGPIAAPQWGFDKAKLLIRQLTRNCGLPGLLTGLPTSPWPGPGVSIDLPTRNSNDETTSQGASKQTPTSRPHRYRFHPSSDTVAQISG